MVKSAYSVNEILKEIGIGRSKLYSEIAAGKLKARKIGIPHSLQNPKILMWYDAKIVCDLVTELVPVFGNYFAEETQDGICELLLSGIELIVCDMFMHDAP